MLETEVPTEARPSEPAAGVNPASDAAADPGPSRRWWALAVLCLSLIVVTIDTTILNVALPSLQRQLHPSSSGLEWIVDAYTVVFAGSLLTAGALGDRYGRKGALSAGLVVFALASAASALAHDANQLIALRAVTGIGAALVFPATLSILTNIFREPVERQRAIAVWAGTAGIGIGLGPVVGGLLLRHFYWGSIFWVNVPVCALALVAGWWLVPTSRDPAQSAIDLPGAALSIVGLSTLVFAIIEGPSKGWTSPTVVGAFAIAIVVLAAFVVVELVRRRPMLDLRLFRNPRFTAASLAVTTLYFALFGTIFFQTLHLQVVLGYDPLGAGLRILPFAVVLLVVANTTPRLVARVGTRAVIVAGMAVAAVSEVGRAGFTVHSGYDAILVTQCLFALGMGLTIAPATASIMGAVPAGRAGVGSAINDTTRQVGGALGVAIMGSVGASIYHRYLGAHESAIHLVSTAAGPAHDSVGGAATVASHLPPNQAAALIEVARHGFIQGLDAASWVAAGVCVLGALVALLFLPRGMRVGAATS
jgi:MFS transporter, DHA2 family, multidrug resistance protein